jgi:RNA polymerase sigma-70 factor, ECF subfamily
MNIENTQKKTAELKEKFESLSGSLCITDPAGTLLYANAGIERRTGFDVPEVIGKKPSELWGGYMPRTFYDHLWNTIQEKKDPFVGRVTNKRKGGEMHEEVIHIAPVFSKAREIKYFIEVHPDVRDRGRERVFEQEFIDHMQSNQAVGSGALDWVSYWMAGENTQETMPTDEGSLYDMLEAHFVAPTDALFFERKQDYDLIVEAQADGAAFSVLYKKYNRRIFYYFLKRVGGSAGSAEDLTQETFMRAFRHLKFFKHKNASYYTYLLRIAHNLLVNFYRKKQAVPFDPTAQDIPAPSKHESFWNMEVLWRAVGSLSQIEQTVLNMKYKEELSIKEVAALLGKTENAIKLHLSRARKKLRVLLGS